MTHFVKIFAVHEMIGSHPAIKNCLVIVLALLQFAESSAAPTSRSPGINIEIVINPWDGTPETARIQEAIDSCAAAGGGIVSLREGLHVSGTLYLRSNITLRLDSGAVLQGSTDYRDYGNDAFIYGERLSNIAIEGYGLIDGVNCHNPNGEEGFRGPHGIRLVDCRKIKIKGITIQNSANWAINVRRCETISVDAVVIRGGHDGLHTRFCTGVKVTNCDFRTGDDAFAGNDNRDFEITDCKINTSCNGFRIGCENFVAKRCVFWGPGEYPHLSQKRKNMLAAFVHFSPKDENPTLRSGTWHLEDITVDNVDNFYNYNFEKGLWQTGQPVTSVTMKNIKATNVSKAFSILGDRDRQFKLILINSSFTSRTEDGPKLFEGVAFRSNAFFNAVNFNRIEIQNVTFKKDTARIIADFQLGNTVILGENGVRNKRYSFRKVKKVLE